MQLSIRFIVCSFGIASTATTAATFESEMTKLLFVAAQLVAGLVADCAVHCCSPLTGWSSAEGSKLRFWSPTAEPAATTVVASLEEFSTGQGTITGLAAAGCSVAVRSDLTTAVVIAGSSSSKAFAAP